MHYDAIFPASTRRVVVALVGVGQFGATFVAQCRHIPRLRLAALCDREPARAIAACLAAGYGEDDLRRCASAGKAAAAIEGGRIAVLDDAALLSDLPLDIVVESTGEPASAAATAERAIAAGQSVALASKETDSVIGPLLAARAHRAGVVCTPVDGDQPSLLLGLISWARALGFEIVAAGKASEYDFVHDAAAGTVTSAGRTVRVAASDFTWQLPDGAAAGTVGQRRQATPGLFYSTAPDLCEMALVVNASGLDVDRAELHAPVARTVELPGLFRPAAEGGLLRRGGVVDIFNCLRRPDEISFAGGVFVVVRAPDEATGRLLAEKGLPTSPDHRHVLLHNPVHLLGMEAPISLLSACLLGRSTAGESVRQRYDLTAVTTRDWRAGERIVLAERHAIDGLAPLLTPAQVLSDRARLPYYLAAGTRLRRAVPAGEALTPEMVEVPAGNALWRLRAVQDAELGVAPVEPR